MRELGELLQMTGGWGLSAVLMFVVWRLWAANNAKDQRISDKDERIFKLLDKQNDILKLLERIDDRRR